MTTGRVVRVGIGTTIAVAGLQVVDVPPVVGVRAAAAAAAVEGSVGATSVPAGLVAAMTVVDVLPVAAAP
ncbi:hypothetical protein OG705_07125 [Streptomyces sp. NBC_00838]|uniref:hypothetical protein n=1 Tax=Streptomyces sp. NBC_00838 TaxID=2903680 RepID=UPI003867F8EA|nr:hypothetical protein OG705_07125 [Streptomyces sp. NBC_00838]